MADSMRVSVKVKFDRLPALTKELAQVAVLSLDKGLAEVQKGSKAEAPFRTGGLRASGFRLSAVHDDYEAAVAAMHRANPHAVAIPKPQLSGLDLYVGFAADYAIYVHDGVHGRAGHPFLVSVIERLKEQLVQTVKADIEAYAGGQGVGSINAPGGIGANSGQ